MDSQRVQSINTLKVQKIVNIYLINQIANTSLRFLTLNLFQKSGVARCQIYIQIFLLWNQHLFIFLYKLPLTLELLVFVEFSILFHILFHFLLYIFTHLVQNIPVSHCNLLLLLLKLVLNLKKIVLKQSEPLYYFILNILIVLN